MAANTPMGYIGLQDVEKLQALLELDADELDNLDKLAAKKTELIALANKKTELVALAGVEEALLDLAAKATELLALLEPAGESQES